MPLAVRVEFKILNLSRKRNVSGLIFYIKQKGVK